MQSHRRQAQQGKPLSNRLDPDQLNDLERRILKEAFRQARKLQSKLVLEYQL
jgi:CBS domain-containing protein